MIRTSFLVRAAILSMIASLSLGADALANDGDQKLPGIAVGEQAPEFALKDQHGKTVTLKSLLGKDRVVALVFYRSADW